MPSPIAAHCCSGPQMALRTFSFTLFRAFFLPRVGGHGRPLFVARVGAVDSVVRASVASRPYPLKLSLSAGVAE